MNDHNNFMESALVLPSSPVATAAPRNSLKDGDIKYIYFPTFENDIYNPVLDEKRMVGPELVRSQMSA